MSKFSVDHELCNQCSICTSVCPLKLISIDYETSMLFVDKTYENRCCQCGHCVINCPSQAIKLKLSQSKFVHSSQGKRIDLSLMPSQLDAEVFLESRRSIRQFKKIPVKHEIIIQILNITQFAPSASNNQVIRWIVVEDLKTTEKISSLYYEWLDTYVKSNPGDEKTKWNLQLNKQGCETTFRSAPHFVIAILPKDYYWYEDAAIALTYFMLAAHSVSVGTCWGGRIVRALRASPILRTELGIKDDEHIAGLVLFGYPLLPTPNYLPPRKDSIISFK